MIKILIIRTFLCLTVNTLNCIIFQFGTKLITLYTKAK